MVFCAVRHVITVLDQFLVGNEAAVCHALYKSLVTLIGNHGVFGTVQEGNLSVPERIKMVDGNGNALCRVRSHIADMWVHWDVIVKENGGNRCLVELLYPVVVQGKAEQECPGEAVL